MEKKVLETQIDKKALFNIGYGLYVVTSHDGVKDNGLIVNSVMQVTNNPARVAVTINKENYSHDIIKQTKKMNVNCLSLDAPFSVFENFGFQSGRNVDKFKDLKPQHSLNGLVVLSNFINSFMSLEVEQYLDLDSHGMFICIVTEAKVVSNNPTMSYDYYNKNVKPKPNTKKVNGYVCKICGWVYEGESLPSDIVCPICKHGVDDFEKIEERKEKNMKKYACNLCGWVYDEAEGLPSEGIPAGTKFEDLPEDFVCPLCGAGKEEFSEE